MPKLCLIFVFLLTAFAASYASAQTLTLPDRFGPWSASSSGSVKADDRAEVLKETGFSGALAKTYSAGGRVVTAALYEFHDPSSAYEIYTSRITPEMLPSTVGNNTGVDRNRLLALAGNRVLEIRPPQSASAADLSELLKAVRAHSDQTPLPPIRTYLPEGFSDGTQRYALGPAGFEAALDALHQSRYANLTPEIGFNNGAEVMLAEYRKGNQSAVLLLIEYPTPQVAEQHSHHLETVVPGGKIERRGSLLSIVLGPSSDAFAQNLHNAVNYETQVTWNEGKHVLIDPPWLIIVGRIFIATAVFLAAAAVLGLVYGGIRIATKVFFPGKVFDRPKTMEVLQLGLSGKPIDTKDFY